MASYILRRFMTALPVLLLITIIVFAVMQVLPGDPARMVLGQEATPQALEAMRERLGLNRPLHEQYLSWLFGVLQGDLGRSMVDNAPVARAIALALPVKIGRASCRERVEISEGAGSVKKKELGG